MTERWEADAKKPAPFRAGFRTSGRGERSAEQRPDADAGIDPAFVDHLDRDIEDHRKADIGDPAIALDIFGVDIRSEEHTSELQSLMRISHAVFCFAKKSTTTI